MFAQDKEYSHKMSSPAVLAFPPSVDPADPSSFPAAAQEALLKKETKHRVIVWLIIMCSGFAVFVLLRLS